MSNEFKRSGLHMIFGAGRKPTPAARNSWESGEFDEEAVTEDAGGALSGAAVDLRRDETAGQIRDVVSRRPAKQAEAPPRYRFSDRPPASTKPPIQPNATASNTPGSNPPSTVRPIFPSRTPTEANAQTTPEEPKTGKTLRGIPVPAQAALNPPSSSKRSTTQPNFREEEPTSTTLRSLSTAFNGLHPRVQSCIARLMTCIDSAYEFNQTYQALLETPNGESNGGTGLSQSSNILFLKGLSTLLDGKVIALPVLASGDPGQHKSPNHTPRYEWKVVNCTDESLDVNLPYVRVVGKDANPFTAPTHSIPLDVVLYYNKPY